MARGPSTGMGIALGLLSAGITAYQVILMQILSYLQWYHFAYMVVSLALLGFGASGTVLALFRRRLTAGGEQLIAGLMTGAGLGMALATGLSQLEIFRFDLYLLFVEWPQIFKLAVSCLLYFIPFFLGALAIGLILTGWAERAGTLYFANLVGSGAGGLIGLVLLSLALPERLPALVALLPVAGGLLASAGKHRKPSLLFTFGAIGLCLALIVWPATLIPSQFKGVSLALNLPDARILQKHFSAHGFVQVVTSKALRQAPGLSLNYRGTLPRRHAFFVNGDPYGGIPLRQDGEYPPTYAYSTEILGYEMVEPRRVLLLGAANVPSILQAFSRGAQRVTAVEPHAEIVTLLRQWADGEPLLFPPGNALELVQADPRSQLAAEKGPFDLIRFPTVGAFGGNVGLYALNEKFLMTREAFLEAWQNLSPGGVIVITSWMDYPVKNPLKVLATLAEMLDAAGVDDPRAHLAAIRSWGAVTFAVKKSVIEPAETARIRERCRALFFDPLILPGLAEAERQEFNRMEDDQFFRQVDALLFGQRQNLYAEYDFNLKPATDNRPYFSQFLRWTRVPQLTELYGIRKVPFFELGSFMIAATFILLSVFAVILIILPLFRLGWRGPGKWRTFFYFGGLGLGFMLLEIVLMQRLTLFLGHPVRAAATVIAALLSFSGLGSLASSKLPARPVVIRRLIGCIALLIVAYAVATTLFLKSGGTLSFPLKAILAALFIAPLGFCLGMPFPLGLRFLNEQQPEHLPWAWAINGCFSVIGPVLAILVAVQAGFPTVFILASTAYLIALAAYLPNR